MNGDFPERYTLPSALHVMLSKCSVGSCNYAQSTSVKTFRASVGLSIKMVLIYVERTTPL